MLEENLIDTFIKFLSKLANKFHATSKTKVKRLDNRKSSDLLDMIQIGKRFNKVYRYISVVLDNYSEYGRIAPLKVIDQTITTEFFIKFRKKIVNQGYMEQTKEKNPLVKWSQKTEVAIALKETEDTHLKQLFFAARIDRRIRDLLEERFFRKIKTNWVDELRKKLEIVITKSSFQQKLFQQKLQKNLMERN